MSYVHFSLVVRQPLKDTTCNKQAKFWREIWSSVMNTQAKKYFKKNYFSNGCISLILELRVPTLFLERIPYFWLMIKRRATECLSESAKTWSGVSTSGAALIKLNDQEPKKMMMKFDVQYIHSFKKLIGLKNYDDEGWFVINLILRVPKNDDEVWCTQCAWVTLPRQGQGSQESDI